MLFLSSVDYNIFVQNIIIIFIFTPLLRMWMTFFVFASFKITFTNAFLTLGFCPLDILLILICIIEIY